METVPILWFATGVLLAISIVILLIRQGLARRVPWFLVYTSYVALEGCMRLCVVGNKSAYFGVYWYTEIFDVIFSILAVGESFLRAFRVYVTLRWFHWILWTVVGLCVAYAILRTFW